MSKIIKASETIEKALFTASLSCYMRIKEEKVNRLGIKSISEKKEQEVPDEVKEGIDEVMVGRPQIFSLMEIYEIEKIKSPADIQIMSKEYDFYLVELACSFVPQKKSEIINLKFKVDLDLLYVKSSSKHPERPIAYDMYPVEIFEEIQEKKSIGINPTLKFQEVKAGVGSFLREITFTRLIPIITGAGVLCPSVVWSFDKTENRKLEGVRRMYMVIKTPKSDMTIVGTIRIFGQINRGRFLFYKYDPIEYTVDLENGILINPKL